MAIVRAFHKYRGVSDLSMDGLIDLLREQVPLIAPRQTRYRVTDLPSARTIRFYTARGLVDKPTAHEGAAARYGYRHLLQLLVVKYLQAQYLPLAKVASLMAGATNRDLELLVPEVSTVAQRELVRQDRRIAEIVGRPAPGAPPAQPPPAVALAAAPVGEADRWFRIEVSPGIELHVHESALPAAGRVRLRGALLREMGRLRGWDDAG